jgi:hypothetical protein
MVAGRFHLLQQFLLDRREEVAELLSYRLVIIAFSVGVNAEGDLLAIHVPQPILTEWPVSRLV